jgi:hypothetical protein
MRRLFSLADVLSSPFTCDVSGDGGNTFQAATVTQQVPGKFGLSFATATDFPLTAQIPAYVFVSIRIIPTAKRCMQWDGLHSWP